MPQPPLFNEMFDADRSVRTHYSAFAEWLAETPQARIAQNRHAADLLFHRVGITFAVYGEASGTERLIPFDIVPHVIPARQWEVLGRGLRQRVTALNRFLHDIYHGQEIIHAGKIPAEQVNHNPQFRREMVGVDVPGGVYAHVAGVDIVRHADGEYYVLEDNLRTPSGVSYMLENRKMMMRLFPELFAQQGIRPVDHYPDLLLETLRGMATRENPTIVLLTPGHYNSAYFEHAFLAQQMGIELVEGADLFVLNNTVFMRTTQGPQKVDVIYRRIDDDFLDPLAFRRDSMLGVPGLLNVYREGNVALANAPGAGVADDKSVYAYMPRLIKYYLGEDPLLPQVPTYLGHKKDDFKFIAEHLDQLVVKTTGDAGGYGMLMGPFAAAKERESYLAAMKKNPGNYIAQPLVELSTHPTHIGGKFEPRRVDLRPFILYGDRIRVLPGGLTRVALRAGSYVVNSSQGGGSKDTWVLAPREA